MLFNWTLEIRLIFCKRFTIINWILLKLFKKLHYCKFKWKRCDPISLCCDFSWVIGFGGVVHLRILFGFKICLIAWPPCFMKCFLWTTTKSFWTLSWTSKGKVFSFLHLCSDVYSGYKINVIEGQLLLGFDAFTFALCSWMFPPFTRYTPSIVFFNGGYNFSVKGYFLKSTALSYPFF